MTARRLIQPNALLLGSFAAAMTAGGGVAGGQDAADATSPVEQSSPLAAHDSQSEPLDPDIFFAQLVERYRRMTAYEDTVSVVQVIEDGDAEPSRVESELACELDEQGKLAVSTPMTDFRTLFSTMLPMRSSDGMNAAEHAHAVWLAPHMSLRFDRSPMQRSSKAPVKPVEARTVQVEDQTVVQLRLSNRTEADESGLMPPCLDHDAEPETTFDLYVNPESMLVQRIESDETLPDGRHQKTTVHIQPLRSASGCGSDGQWTEVSSTPGPTCKAAPAASEFSRSDDHGHAPPRKP